jgi:hypothetical protein
VGIRVPDEGIAAGSTRCWWAGEPHAAGARRRCKVLLVEDNPLVVEMYSYVLKKLAIGELRGRFRWRSLRGGWARGSGSAR